MLLSPELESLKQKFDKMVGAKNKLRSHNLLFETVEHEVWYHAYSSINMRVSDIKKII